MPGNFGILFTEDIRQGTEGLLMFLGDFKVP